MQGGLTEGEPNVMDKRITVPQVAKAMGVVLESRVAWAVGSEMASQYQQAFGEQPPKENRPKTSGSGSHCFALYPPTWEERIRGAIEEHLEMQARQVGLFE